MTNEQLKYIDQLQAYAIKNPAWFWSDAEDASKARQWLYDNGASKIVDDIYNRHTPDNIKTKINPKKLSSAVRTKNLQDDIVEGQNAFLDTAGAVALRTAPIILATPAAVAAPGVVLGGIVGGTIGNEVTNKLVNYLSNGKYSDWGSLFRGGKDYGQTLNTFADFTNPGALLLGGFGAKGGNSLYSNLSNRFTFNQALKNGQIEFTGPTNYTAYHQSDKVIPKFDFPYNRWDVKTHGADPNGAFFSKQPVTKGFLSERPVVNKYNISSNKTLVQHGDITPNIDQSKNGIRNYIVKQARKNGADVVRFEDIADNTLQGQNVLFATDNSNIKFLGIDPKNPISTAERLGIPKGERGNFSRYQKEALEDLEYLIDAHKKDKIVIRNGKVQWVSKVLPGDEMFVRNMISKGATWNDYSGLELNTPKEYIAINPEAARFQYAAGFNGLPGEAQLMSNGIRSGKIILTSPIMAAQIEKLPTEGVPNMIPKPIMKTFWSALDEYVAPGTYVSGDQNRNPMGFNLWRLWNNRNTISRKPLNNGNTQLTRGGDLNSFYNMLQKQPKVFARDEGLSSDSYMAILKQGNRPRHKLRFSSDGFNTFNNQGVENKWIADLLEATKKGEVSQQEFINQFNNWVTPYNGMPAVIRNGEISIPHPFILYKHGGKLNAKTTNR